MKRRIREIGHAGNDQEDYEDVLSEVQDAILCWGSQKEEPDPDELWKWPRVREAVRPVLADIGETSQFLAAKQMVLKGELSATCKDLFTALHP